MASNLTIYFAWVDQTDNVFTPTFARFDEHVFNFSVECDEGQIPKLNVEVINPRIGPLAPGRLYWAWLSMSEDGGATFIPLFFGRIVGIPQSILANTVKYQFIARSSTYIRQKQLVAESLKVLPNYDPIFFDLQKRDDPDAILEGWSSLYAVDRVTNTVSASDILIGEDGTLAIAAADTFYDSVQMKLEQSPLVAVNVKAEVTWEQQFTGTFDVGKWAYPTLGNEPFVGDWPKSGANLGGGYSGSICFAGIRDPFIQVQTSSNININYTWQDNKKHHANGDLISTSYSASIPTQPMAFYQTSSFWQQQNVSPYAVDSNGDPDPINIPSVFRIAYFGIRTFRLDFAGMEAVATMSLRYDANRKRSEQLEVTVQADVQPILVDPLITEDTETITLKSGDLALPLIDLLNWSSVSGLPVAQGTFIFPDNPLVPGQTSSQICIGAGTAGAVEPLFSNIAGVTTADGSVVWSSLGSTPPTENAQDWVQSARVSLGTLLIPRPLSGCPSHDAYLGAGNLGNPPTGVPTPKYLTLCSVFGAPGETMYQCTSAGILGGSVVDKAAKAVVQTFINPSGQSLFICIEAGITDDFHTTFDETPGALTSDGISGGTVIWQCLGKVSLPIGGWPSQTPASSYFPTDRGLQSLEHMICRARAKLRRRARAVQVSFQCRLEAVSNISCRMNASITDTRLPGGSASGKVISYKLQRDGDSGKTWADVTIGCSIGKGGASSISGDGTATYVDGVFNQGEVEVWAGSTILLANSADIGYTPPVPRVVDDGLSFPLFGFGDVILTSEWHGTASTINPENVQDYNAEIAAAVSSGIANGYTAESVVNPVVPEQDSTSFSESGGVTNAAQNAAALTAHVNRSLFQGTYLWYELCLKNLNGGPYAAAYVISPTSLLAIPQTIDLSAPSSG